MKSKKKVFTLLIIVICISCIYFAREKYKDILQDEAINYADNFINELSNKYKIDDPKFTITTSKSDDYLLIHINFYDKKFELLSDEKNIVS